jgi:hypothetical protein
MGISFIIVYICIEQNDKIMKTLFERMTPETIEKLNSLSPTEYKFISDCFKRVSYYTQLTVCEIIDMNACNLIRLYGPESGSITHQLAKLFNDQ